MVAEGSFEAPVTLRRGEQGERMDSLRGDFDLARKPLLADVGGPFGTPITDSSRVAVGAATRRAWLVAYLPAGVVDGSLVEAALCGPLGGIARIESVFHTGDADASVGGAG